MRAASKRGGIPLDVAARIISQVCAGLHAAHELKDESGQLIGLVHRDISPQNVLLNGQGIAKVVDFGVAKFAGRGVAATQVGELRGKVPYMAPEHIRGQELDRRADVFALGLLFYQLVAGEHPFLADNDQLTMARISSAASAPPLLQLVPGVPEELSRIVAAALEKSPAARTPTAAAFMHQIERVVPDAGLQSTNDRVAEYLKEIVGEVIEARDQELRDALRRLDGRPSIPPAPREQAPPPGRPSAPPHLGSQGGQSGISPIMATPAPIPMTPPLGTPLGVYGPTSSAGALNNDDLLPMTGWRATWIGRHPRIAAAGLIAAIVGVIIGISAVGSTPDDVPASPASASASPVPSSAATIGAASPSASSSAPASAASSGSSPSGSASAIPSLLPRGTPAGGSAIKPPPLKGTARPSEYTPGGL
jgi:serine/threonine-protein kinase